MSIIDCIDTYNALVLWTDSPVLSARSLASIPPRIARSLIFDMPLDTRHLRLLNAIVDEGGVSAAARKLHLTQPALSHQLHAAESELGARLFDRINKKMVLTPAGQRLLDRSRPILRELDAAEKELRLAPSAPVPVRISTECYTCYH